MRKIKEILRLKWDLGFTHREISQRCGSSSGAVTECLKRAQRAGLSWPLPDIDDAELETRLYPPAQASRAEERPLPKMSELQLELRRPGVTLRLLWDEYIAAHPKGYRYTQFCVLYDRWLKTRKPTMRQVHIGGDKLFVDYSGKRPVIVDRETGELKPVELFVAVLGASSWTYAEATPTQQSPDWIASHIRTYEKMGGVPRTNVPDQLRSGVSVPCRYEPTAQRTYGEMCRHYGTSVFPARPRKPRDKAKAEVGVQVVQRWILARIRNERFFSIEELNERIAELLVDLNDRQMRDYGASRQELFERLDRPNLTPLPPARFIFAEWKKATVNIDYHIELERHYYSVPFQLIQQEIEVRYTATTVEVLHKGRRVASHLRSYKKGAHTTVPEHMPKAHQAHLEWTPSRLIDWGKNIGPSTAQLVAGILESRPHPEQGYRACLGVLSLAKRYGDDRLEAACRRALAISAPYYRTVKSILEKRLEHAPLPNAEPQSAPIALHSNIRGSQYYLSAANPPLQLRLGQQVEEV